MKLKSLKVNNFRRFYGIHKIDFSIDPKKKFTIVHAENGTGKTNILRAVNWCLFDHLIDLDEDEDPNPTNNIHKVEVSKKESSLDCYVDLEILKDNGEIYRFRRKQTSLKDNVISAWVNDITATQSEANLMIEEVLPSALSKYFLFHGEGLKTLTRKSENISKAIEDIQGIGDALEVLKVLQDQVKSLNKKINSSDKASAKLKAIGVRKSSIERDINKISKELKKAKQDQKEAIEDWEDLVERQGNSNVQARKQASEDRKDAEKSLDRKKLELKNHLQTRKTNVISHYAGLMGYKASLDCREIKVKMELEGRLPERLTKMLVDDILEKEICICKRCVEPGSEAWSAIKEWENVVGDPTLTMRLMELASKNNEGIKNTQAFIDSLKDHTNATNIYENDIKELELNIDRYSAILGDNDSTEDDLELENKIQQAKSLKDSKSEQVEVKQFQLIQKTRDLEPVEKEYLKHLKDSKVDTSLKKQIEFLDIAKNRLHSVITSQREKAKEDIKNNLIEMIDTYANKGFKVEFNENFIPKVYEQTRGVWQKVPPSTGERLLLNLCFISCLVDVSITKIEKNQNSRFSIKGINPPLLIDAPFGDASSYREQITSVLENCQSEQIIILLAKDYYEDPNFKQKIDKYTGKRYVLESYMTEKETKALKKKHEKYTENKFVEINGKKIQQLFSTKEDGYTNIKEVNG